jgi:hypothetical protein
MGAGDHSEFNAFVRRVLRAYGRRVAAADVEDLAELLAVRAAVDEAIDRAVAGLREAGRSWTEIAKATGTTRQAVQQRYATRIAVTSPAWGSPKALKDVRATADDRSQGLVVTTQLQHLSL